MFAKFFLKRSKQKKLTARLEMLKNKKDNLQNQLTKTKQGNTSNARRSDRQFKENRGKAITTRAKRANKAALLDIERQIRFTEVKLKQLSENQNSKK